MPHVPRTADGAYSPLNGTIKIAFRCYKLSGVEDDVIIRCGFNAWLAIPEAQKDFTGFSGQSIDPLADLRCWKQIRVDDHKTLLLGQKEIRLE